MTVDESKDNQKSSKGKSRTYTVKGEFIYLLFIAIRPVYIFYTLVKFRGRNEITQNILLASIQLARFKVNKNLRENRRSIAYFLPILKKGLILLTNSD